MRNRTTSWLLTGLVVIIGLLIGPSATSETILLERQLTPLEPGVRYVFHTDQKHQFVATYTAAITILDVDRDRRGRPEAVRFAWRMYNSPEHPKFDSRGTVRTLGLKDGRSLNSWWSSGNEVTTEDTHQWLSTSACRELRASGRTRFSIDRDVRKDPPLWLTKVGPGQLEVFVDGERVSLAGIKLETELGDRLLVLDDCDHPLILEADVPGIYAFRLEQVHTRPAAP